MKKCQTHMTHHALHSEIRFLLAFGLISPFPGVCDTRLVKRGPNGFYGLCQGMCGGYIKTGTGE